MSGRGTLRKQSGWQMMPWPCSRSAASTFTRQMPVPQHLSSVSTFILCSTSIFMHQELIANIMVYDVALRAARKGMQDSRIRRPQKLHA